MKKKTVKSPMSVKRMMKRFRSGNPPHPRKRFQIALVIHAVDRETAIDELENKLATFRENRIGEGGVGGFRCSMAYAIVDGDDGGRFGAVGR